MCTRNNSLDENGAVNEFVRKIEDKYSFDGTDLCCGEMVDRVRDKYNRRFINQNEMIS